MQQIINQNMFIEDLLWAVNVLVDGSIANKILDIKIHALLEFAFYHGK